MAPKGVAADVPIVAYTLAPAVQDRAEAHARERGLEYLVAALLPIVFLWLVLRLRVAARLQELVKRVPIRLLQPVLFTFALLLVQRLLRLPVAAWQHDIELSFGLSPRSWSVFLDVWFMESLFTVLAEVCVACLILALIRRAPRRWWLLLWAVSVPMLALETLASQNLMDLRVSRLPRLQSYGDDVVEEFQAVSARAGYEIPIDRVFVIPTREETPTLTLHASSTGFGSSRRIVLWDKVLTGMRPREAAFVFGHEIGHLALNHALIRLGRPFVETFMVLWLTAMLSRWLIARFGPGWGVSAPQDFTALVVIWMAWGAVSLAADPVSRAFDRAEERQADAFAVKAIEGVVDDPAQAAAHALQKMGESTLEDPDPSLIAVLLLYDHPPIRDRIQSALRLASAHPAGPS